MKYWESRVRLSNVACGVGGFTAALFFVTLLSSREHSPLPSTVVEIALEGREPVSDTRKELVAFVGVQTGFTSNHVNPKYNYEKRRESLRASWLPANESARQLVEAESGVVVQFVVGHSADAEAEAAMNAEEAKHGGFLRLDLEEGYADLPRKTLLFFSTVMRKYNPKYIVKVDDDVYLRIDRIPAAVEQWTSVGADYIGCMKGGQVIKSPKYRWYEPNHALLGPTYFTHAWGSAYVVSRRTSSLLTAIPPENLRRLANEDVTLGSWMLALDLVHYDDRRMCTPHCTPSSLAVYDYPTCAGLCDAAGQLLSLHASPECQDPALTPTGGLPLMDSMFYFPGGPDAAWEAKALAQMARKRREQADKAREA